MNDECPHCRLPLEIVSVKLSLRGVAMVHACTNCAITRTEIGPSQQILRHFLGALRMIGIRVGRSSSEAFREAATRGDAGESVRDAHNRLE
jgi:hypothetical protein